MKKMKKLFALMLILNLFFISTINVWATADYEQSKINTVIEREVSRAEIFSYISNYLLSDIPKSYKYIDLKYTDVKLWTKLYENLQKLVYVDAISNNNIKINSEKKVSSYDFYKLIAKVIWIDLVSDDNTNTLKNRNTNVNDFLVVNSIMENYKDDSQTDWNNQYSREENEKFQMLFNVYSTILNNHYDSWKLDKDKMIYSAIEWLAEWTWDKYTTFFPPVEARDFDESLSWEFEWIWAYVELEKPWQLKIISPVSWYPAEAAWLKWWDIVIKVNWKEIDEKLDANWIVSLIKWPAWTTVNLTILRWDETFDVEVTRAKITLHDVEYKVLNWDTFYIQIRMFWDKVFDEFQTALTELKKTSWIRKVVIDLRNNPGWYLDQVTKMMSLFLDKWLTTAVVKYRVWEEKYTSDWYNLINLWNYDLYVLWNSWTASASEIMIWTMKDYFPNMQIVWEQTYWKWSVQTITYYDDWSSFKYTIARWYTWKTQNWIDWVWIKPDVKIELDQEWFKNWKDNQLDYILWK